MREGEEGRVRKRGVGGGEFGWLVGWTGRMALWAEGVVGWE